MTKTPERHPEYVESPEVWDATPGQMVAWSTEEVKSEVDQTMRDLEKARQAELAARIAARTRSNGEETQESEAALQMRREEVSCIHRRYISLLDELEVRSESYP